MNPKLTGDLLRHITGDLASGVGVTVAESVIPECRRDQEKDRSWSNPGPNSTRRHRETCQIQYWNFHRNQIQRGEHPWILVFKNNRCSHPNPVRVSAVTYATLRSN